jgi:hypothetical protein
LVINTCDEAVIFQYAQRLLDYSYLRKPSPCFTLYIAGSEAIN